PPRLMRIVEGLRGRVPMQMELSLRPDYASIVPWVESVPDGVIATAGPDAFRLSTGLPLEAENGTVRADFVALEGARERLPLTWHFSCQGTASGEGAASALAGDGASGLRRPRRRPRTARAHLALVVRGDAIRRGRRLGARAHGSVVASVER